MNVYYIANARMPTEKAHGIQIAKMCEAFIEAGISVELVVPSRKTVKETVQEFYGLRVPVRMTRLFAPDLYTYGTLGYRISSCIFMLTSLFFLWSKKIKGEKFVVYTVDLDNFSSSALAFSGAPLYSEMHGGKPNTFAQRLLFKKVRGIFAINSIIVDELKKNFPFSKTMYLVEPNGVDPSNFLPVDKNEARKYLGLPLEKRIVLYTGRFFDWKGLEILAHASALASDVLWYLVGGTESHFKEYVPGKIPANLYFAGSRPHKEMRYWFSAADALVVLGTKRDRQSYYYTSPMKLFEYLLSGRPIVASKTPAIEQIVSDHEVLFYEPDNEAELAKKAVMAAEQSPTTEHLVLSARTKAANYTWKARAERIKNGIVATYEH